MAETLPPRDQIQVLLAEYATLREEITQRGGWQIQMFTLAGTSVVAIVGYLFATGQIVASVILLLIVVALLTCGLVYNDQDSRALAAKVRLLESDINRLAGVKLLSWETNNGLLAVGYLKRLKRHLRRG